MKQKWDVTPTMRFFVAAVVLATAQPMEAYENTNANEASAEEAEAQNPSPTGTLPPDADRLHVDVYPIFGWLPFFSSNFTIPPFPGGGGGGSIPGSTDLSVSGAFVFAVNATYKKLLIEGEGMFGNFNGNHSTPNADVSAHLDYGDVFVGWNVWKGLYPTVGFRRIAVDFNATVANAPTFSRKPGVWDPMIGVDFRRQLKHKINVQGRFDIGGFGVGSTVDLDAQARVEWRFVKHFGVLGGYQVLYDKIDGHVERQFLGATFTYPWSWAQTFHGPILGLGIYF